MLTDYSYYKNVFHGDLLTEDNYEKYAKQADVWLNYFTNGAFAQIEAQRSWYNLERTGSGVTEPSCRYREASGYGTCLDDAECAISDLCLSMETDAASNPSIAKETVGSHSVTYRTGEKSDSLWREKIYGVISRYLMTTGLLYRGTCLVFKL